MYGELRQACRGLFVLVVLVAHFVLEAADRLTHPATEAGQTVGAEDEQQNQQDDDQLGETDRAPSVLLTFRLRTYTSRIPRRMATPVQPPVGSSLICAAESSYCPDACAKHVNAEINFALHLQPVNRLVRKSGHRTTEKVVPLISDPNSHNRFRAVVLAHMVIFPPLIRAIRRTPRAPTVSV